MAVLHLDAAKANKRYFQCFSSLYAGTTLFTLSSKTADTRNRTLDLIFTVLAMVSKGFG